MDISSCVTAVIAGILSSNGEAKPLIQQGGITVNDEQVKELGKTFSKDELVSGLKIRKGKKHFHKAVIV